ncbi:MAG TPA: formin, partial [Polyangiaceae bacterium]|nr:formin [Polyangiaceae bacterium]
MSEEETSGAEDKPKKRKIDLKSRLSSVRAAGTFAGPTSPSSSEGRDPLSFPPPPTGSVPAPRLPGVSKPSSPFAPPEPEVKKTAQQQTIKVEIGEEVVAERRKTQRKMLIYVALAGAVGLFAGWQVGQVYERGKTGFKAVENAKALAADIESANKSMISLSDAIGSGSEKIGSFEYPAELVDTLQKTNVPFSTDNFTGKGVSGLPPEVQKQLLSYTSGVEDLNAQKDKLRNLLGASKAAIEKYAKQRKSPVVNFSVIFDKQNQNPVAVLVPNKDPFEQGATWPQSYKVVKPQEKESKEIDVERYGKAGPFDK